MGFRNHFRDTQELLDSTNGNINLNTCSDVAAINYDATITQLVGWYQDDAMGGLQGTANKMIEADPDFVLGRALDLELSLSGALSAPGSGETIPYRLAELEELVERKGSEVNEHELLHVQVVKHWANREFKESTRVLEKIATSYPEDVAALKMNQDTYFMLGTALQMRNSLAASLARMSSKNPLKGYVHGMFAFALEESNMYPQSQSEALKAIQLIPFDTWAIHNYAHCLEMQGKSDEGLKWMYEMQPEWQKCQTLACHQYWHTALFHINNDEFDAAVELLDQEILSRCMNSCSSLDLHDAASMMYRMQLVDLFGKVNDEQGSADRWSQVYDVCEPLKHEHLIGFNDAHYLMSFLGMDDLQGAREIIDSVDQAPSLVEGSSVVKPLLEAMYQFKVGAYDKCVDLLEPIRFDVVKIGGSHAQRDVFEQLLLVAALKSDKPAQNKLGQRMILERETMHGAKLPQTKLLEQQARD